MAGSTVPSPAPSLWTRPRALQPTRRSRIRNLITGRTQVFQQSQVKLKYLAEIEISNNAPEAKLLQVNLFLEFNVYLFDTRIIMLFKYAHCPIFTSTHIRISFCLADHV